ncbi:hypothetical protein OGAPHI_006668 [Ogataea philodendri]|uniref:Pre-mRNA-splicing factor RSE1 n=1 Tax=Ogataea philodendri TaxID=1378263 RepID=A0A9P8T0B6_9ASCO|nr:uncharacterized protein OGAPHI_006668 [Ogataea philodendri]KAH3661261.1 hypothetical protein OGAPHI_006668 [Ogataea philodendri]
MSLNPDLSVYSLTIRPSVTGVKCCIGNFTGNKKQQEVVRATATSIELWKLNRNNGDFYKVVSQNTFSHLRTIECLRSSGSEKDLLIVTSDSGNLTVLEMNNAKGRFESVSNEPYFKTGLRRISPGEYIAVDGLSRAAMVAAIEKNKFVYKFTADHKHNLQVSSPLEANKSKVITFATCGLDVGFENPQFASLECDYSDLEDSNKKLFKTLCYYELDIGLNHVVKRYSEDVSFSSNLLIALPGGGQGPSGVLLCSEGIIQYKCLSKMTHTIPIPRRNGQKKHSRAICGVVHKLKNTFFVLIQTELGDLFKVTLDYIVQDSDESRGEAGLVNSVEIQYFDTMPICSSLLIFRAGFLYANCESGDQYLYQFEKLGDENARKFNSQDYPDEIAVLSDENTEIETRPFENLNLVNIVENINPMVDARLHNSNETTSLPVIYSLCGTGPRSALKVLNHELPFSELVAQELPSTVKKVFACKLSRDDEYDKYIVLSFVDGTLVLRIGEEVEEVENSGLNLGSNTLGVFQIGNNSLVQVHPTGVRQIFYQDDSPQKTTDWAPPPGIRILHCTGTNSQLAVALSNREVVYFELDELDRLIEYNEHKEFGSQITSIALGELQSGEARFPYLLIGCQDKSLTVLSTDFESTLATISEEVLSSAASSLMVCYMRDTAVVLSKDADDDDEESELATSVLYVHIGMESGVYARLQMDLRSGDLSNPRNKYTGPRGVQLSKLEVTGQNAVCILSSRTYLGYSRPSEFKITPLTKPVFEDVCSLKSQDIPENGVLAVYGNNLVILTIDQLENDTLIENIGLRYTPRHLCDCTDKNGIMYILENDMDTKGHIDEDKSEEYQQFGYDRVEGQWASCIQAISVAEKRVLQTVEMANETVLRACWVNFDSKEGQPFLAVSSAQGLKLPSRNNNGAFISLYKIASNGSLELFQRTKTDHIVCALTPFQGRLLAGCENELILYDVGLKQLVKRSSTRLDCFQIVDLKTQGFRVVVADVRDSVRFAVFKPLENVFVDFIDDSIQRHVTRMLQLDYDTVVVGDKFGNISILRCPEQVSEMSDEDNHGFLVKMRRTKLENPVNFYVGDMPTFFQKGTLTIGGSESIIYGCLQGQIGCLHPLTSVSEINFFKELQKQMIREFCSLTERDYMKFRGYYNPPKNCIDGDLMEEYYHLPGDKRIRIASNMDRLPRDIDRRISDMRSRLVY